MPQSRATEIGEVLHLLPGQQAKVKIPKHSTCQGCAHRSFCDPFGTEHMVVQADNPIAARSGQQVELSFHPEKQLKAITILYVIPLVALVLGAVLGNGLALFGSPDASAALLSLTCVILAFAAIRWFTRRQEMTDNRQQPRITRIVENTPVVENSHRPD